MGVKRSRGMVLTIEDGEVLSEQSESEAEEGKVLDADFEFDGGGMNGGIMGIEDDEWGFKDVLGMKESASVDLEGIIAKRRKIGNEGKISGVVTRDDEDDAEEDKDVDDNKNENEEMDNANAESNSETEEWTGFNDNDNDIGIPCTY
jgi:hypothetical protein